MSVRQWLITLFLMIGFANSLEPNDLDKQPSDGKPQSPNNGWHMLFDGHTLTGWEAIPKESAQDWTVRNGAIVGSGSADRLSYLVWKDKRLKNFELRLRYRLPGRGNSGIEVRSRPDRSGKRPLEGYHADLGHIGIGPHILGAWDFHFAQRGEPPCPRGSRLTIGPDGKLKQTSIADPLSLTDLHPDGWNDVRIVAQGNHLQFFINGKLASEFIDNARKGRLERGAIALQIHDKDMLVEFKDLWLRRRAPEMPK